MTLWQLRDCLVTVVFSEGIANCLETMTMAPLLESTTYKGGLCRGVILLYIIIKLDANNGGFFKEVSSTKTVLQMGAPISELAC